jgi:DNA topoisomerase-1
MPSNLLIVESPAKAKTIEKYLGKDFKVKSSYGHVRDLPKKENAVDIENGFKPKYVVSPDKTKVVKELKEWVAKVDHVWLATDEDREGEAISWHLCELLGLDPKTTKRIVFREITKSAIENAVKQPRTVDLNLVDAQQARRILDRLVGFELSGLLWRKVKTGLSAGRVQSVTVRLVVEREREIQDFKSSPFYRINAIFNVLKDGKHVELAAELPARYDEKGDAETFLNKCVNASFKIDDILIKPLKRKPTAPFTTSTLQQEASRKLGFAVRRTMGVAQKLYEAGHITYMRTDSVNLSETALQNIADEIVKSFGQKYLFTRRFKTKKDNAQEAHEAIRPTDITKNTVAMTRDEQRLYELIWKRTIASQMAEAQLEKTTVKIGVSSMPGENLNATGEVLKFDGFLKVYIESKDDDDEDDDAKGILPPLKVGQGLDLAQMTAIERFTRPPARYTEAGLVKKLEELGIGRPSTYAPTISRIMEPKRGYVIKDSRDGAEREYSLMTLAKNQVKKETKTEMTGAIKNRLISTDMGKVVTDFLAKNFDDVMDYGFTAAVEKQFDEIANGDVKWQTMMAEFYKPFHEDVVETLEKAGRESGERILGTDPESGNTVLVRMNKFGRPMVQIGVKDELGEDEKPKYGNFGFGQTLETITFAEAMKCFDLPKTLGDFQETEVVIAVGRFGPYVKHDEKYVSIPRGEDPFNITMERAQELILEKQEADKPVGTYKGIPYTKGKGRFGPFLKYDKYFVNVPKRYDFENLSVEDSHELIGNKIEKEANRYIHQWEDLDLSVQNGRWGPFIKWKKLNVKLPKRDDERVTPEQAKELTLEDVKKLVEAEYKGAFDEKKKPAKKKKAAVKKKPAAKKK